MDRHEWTDEGMIFAAHRSSGGTFLEMRQGGPLGGEPRKCAPSPLSGAAAEILRLAEGINKAEALLLEAEALLLEAGEVINEGLRENARLAEKLAAEKRQAAEINGWKNDCEGERMRLAEEVERLKGLLLGAPPERAAAMLDRAYSKSVLDDPGVAGRLGIRKGATAERARIRRELLAATVNGLEERHMRALLDRICPEG